MAKHFRTILILAILATVLVVAPILAQESTEEPAAQWTLTPQMSFVEHIDGNRIDLAWGVDGNHCMGRVTDFAVTAEYSCNMALTGLYSLDGYDTFFFNEEYLWSANDYLSNPLIEVEYWDMNGTTDVVFGDGQYLTVENGDVKRRIGDNITRIDSFVDEDGEDVNAVLIESIDGYSYWIVDTESKIWSYSPYATPETERLKFQALIGFDVTLIESTEYLGVQYLYVGGEGSLILFFPDGVNIDGTRVINFDGTLSSLSFSPRGNMLIANYVSDDGELAYIKHESLLFNESRENVIGVHGWYLPSFMWENAGDMVLFSLDSDGTPTIGLAPTSLQTCHWTENGISYNGEFALDEECPQST